MGRPLPSSGAFSGVLEALAFFRDPEFARRRFERLGDVFETKLLGQQLVFIRGERAITDLLGSSDATEGWWPGVCVSCWAAVRWPIAMVLITVLGAGWWDSSFLRRPCVATALKLCL